MEDKCKKRGVVMGIKNRNFLYFLGLCAVLPSQFISSKAHADITLEAERMSLTGYKTANLDGASLVMLTGTTGVVKQTFAGTSGTYNVNVVVYAEEDGVPTLELLVGSVSKGKKTYPSYKSGSRFQTLSFSNVALKTGDVVQLKGTANLGAVARIDKVVFVAVGTSTPTPPPTSGGGGSGYQFPSTGVVSSTPLTLKSTFHNISVYWKPKESGSGNRQALVRYRKVGTTAWIEGHPLWFDGRSSLNLERQIERSQEYRGSIVTVSPDTSYEVQVYLTGIGLVGKGTVKTWSENFKIKRTVSVGSSSKTLTITEGGSEAEGYVVYKAANSGSTIDVANAADFNVDIKAPYVIVKDLTLKGAKKYGIRIDPNVTHIVIDGNDISNWGSRASPTPFGVNYEGAITLRSPSTKLRNLVIQNNDLHDPRYDTNNWSELNVNMNYHPQGAQGVTLENMPGPTVIRYNRVYSNNGNFLNDGFGGMHNNEFTKGFGGPDSDIYGNQISQCWDDGIEIEGSNQNVRVYNNYITEVFTAHGAAATFTGPLYIFRDVVNNLRRTPGPASSTPGEGLGSGVFYKSKANVGVAGGRVYLYHNTMLNYSANNWGKGITGHGYGPYNLVTRNNIIRARSAIEDGVGDPKNDLNFDMIDGSITGVRASQFEKAGIKAAPVFDTSMPANKRGLKLGSLGQDSGAIKIPNFNVPFVGKGPDMGAIDR